MTGKDRRHLGPMPHPLEMIEERMLGGLETAAVA
jgi:hypothetical protein